jgi:pimeloyl-ACP methyl ester carboxylesterase
MELMVDGHRVFAATGGKDFDPSLPTLVFIHGAGSDRTGWRLQTRYFAHHGRSVLAIDLPGHGRSTGAPLATIGALADFIPKLLDAAKVQKAALIGHSMGALTALEAGARYPDRVWALALLGIAATMPVHPELLDAAHKHEHKSMELIAHWGIGKPLAIGGMKTPGLWLTGEVLRVSEQAQRGSIGVDMAACNDYQGALEAAARIRCPTLFILGDGDQMTPAAKARALAEKIPGAKTVIIKGCGHMIATERPDETLAALKEIV